MTYKEVIDIVRDICDNHYLINQFGYGNISDINTPEDEEAPDYPYCFLNPTNVVQTDNVASFNFNLIMMTQGYDTETDYITQQSNMIDTLNEVISNINFNLRRPYMEFVTPYTITPFKERFSDNVVGATASLTIQYQSLLNDCNSPIG